VMLHSFTTLAKTKMTDHMMWSHTNASQLSHSGRRKPEHEKINPACREVELQQGCSAWCG
jgi:hypothetical protein